jgi:hypothetical protein
MGIRIQELNKRETDYQLEPVFRIPTTEQYYVPHYLNPHEWVGLGGDVWTTEEILKTRARPEFKCMWTRPWVEKELFKGKPRNQTTSELEVLIRARS